MTFVNAAVFSGDPTGKPQWSSRLASHSGGLWCPAVKSSQHGKSSPKDSRKFQVR